MKQDRNSPGEVLARRLTRNVLAGIVVMYGVTVAICLPALSLSAAAGVAVLPSVFAGPFVGGLVTMVMSQRKVAAIGVPAAVLAAPSDATLAVSAT